MASVAEDAILRTLLRYYYLTARQVCRLFYRPGSLSYVQAKLKHLTDTRYLQRLFLPRPMQHGSAPSVYTLARPGLNWLREHGADIPPRFRPSEHRAHSYLFLSHLLAVNDVLLAAELLCRQSPYLTLAAMRHDRDLARQPVQVTITDHGEPRTSPVVPDGWLDLRLNGSEQVCLALELDRGTEQQQQFRRKIRALVAYTQGPYQQHFGTESLTIAVVATPGAQRREALLRWTEAELAALGATDQADLFRFSSVAADTLAPEEVFGGAHWSIPFRSAAVPLIEGVGSS